MNRAMQGRKGKASRGEEGRAPPRAQSVKLTPVPKKKWMPLLGALLPSNP